MRKSILKFYALTFALAIFTACDKDDNDPIINEETITEEPIVEEPIVEEPVALQFKDMESDWVRLSLMREGKIDVMQADTGEIKYSVESNLVAGARYYTSNSGQFLTVIERAEGKVRFFDAGIVNHEDHGHEYEARWLGVEVNSLLPTHYASAGGHMLIFNDGDGSITHINEAQLEIPSYKPETFQLTGTVAHHGAGFRLDNGQFVATFKNNSEPGGLPQMVKFVDADGNVIDDNGGVLVTGIHGDAVNGAYGVFGSTDGVILADNQGNIDLIANVEGLNFESGNWIGTLKGNDHSDLFFGRSRNIGVFMIDPSSKTMSKIYSGGDVIGDMFSFDGHYYLVQTADNKIRVYDSHDGKLLKERTVEMASIPALPTGKSASLTAMEEPSPVLVTSDKFLYVLAPNRTQIKVLEINSLNHVHTIELDEPVESIMKNGFSIEGEQHGDHNH